MKRIFFEVIGIVILILSVLFSVKQCKEIKRISSNFEIEAQKKSEALFLTKKEVAENYAKIDSLRVLLGIRPKTVQTIFKTAYNYIDSIELIPVYKVETNTYYDTIKVVKEYSIKTPCYDLNIAAVEDTLYHSLNYHDNMTGFISWERKHKFWFVRWGEKIYTLKLNSECQNTLIPIEKLIIQN